MDTYTDVTGEDRSRVKTNDFISGRNVKTYIRVCGEDHGLLAKTIDSLALSPAPGVPLRPTATSYIPDDRLLRFAIDGLPPDAELHIRFCYLDGTVTELVAKRLSMSDVSITCAGRTERAMFHATFSAGSVERTAGN